MGAIENSLDVVVMGGGLAGLTAANRAAEQGLSVVVLEQGTEAKYTCNTRYSGGLLHVAFKDVQASPVAITAAIGKHDHDYALTHAPLLAQESARAVEWLQSAGAQFEINGPFKFQRWIFAPMRPRIARLDWRGYGPDQLLERLRARLESQGARMRLGARVETLVIDNGRVRGVQVREQGQPTRYRARSVIIADGAGSWRLLTEWRQVLRASPWPRSLQQ